MDGRLWEVARREVHYTKQNPPSHFARKAKSLWRFHVLTLDDRCIYSLIKGLSNELVKKAVV